MTKFLGWYLKIATVSALCGASMELFMIKTGFCDIYQFKSCNMENIGFTGHLSIQELQRGPRYILESDCGGNDDKVTDLEVEKQVWDSSPETQAIREALNPWRKQDSETKKAD